MAQYISGLVIEKNNHVFLTSGQLLQRSAGTFSTTGIGVIMGDIPVPGNSNGGASIDGDYWAIPVDDGVFGGYNFVPYNPNVNAVQPDPQAFPVFKLSLIPPFGSDYWIIVGTVAQYLTAAGGGAALPTTVVYNGALLAQTPCQTLCYQNATTGLYYGVLGIPTNSGGINVNYYPYGYFNGVALPLGSSTGYTTVTSLLSFLNASWSSVGTWTLSPDNRSLIVTEGSSAPGTDILCASVVTINPS
jgi:hypothetical protein